MWIFTFREGDESCGSPWCGSKAEDGIRTVGPTSKAQVTQIKLRDLHSFKSLLGSRYGLVQGLNHTKRIPSLALSLLALSWFGPQLGCPMGD